MESVSAYSKIERQQPVYLKGQALISSLGLSLDSAVEQIQALGQQDFVAWHRTHSKNPAYWQIDLTAENWLTRASLLILKALEQAGCAEDLDAPLWIASSSLSAGAFEENLGKTCPLVDTAEQFKALLRRRGPVYVIPMACTASSQAVLAAQAFLSAGQASHAIVLGLELDNILSVSGFQSMQLLTSYAVAPLGAERTGIQLAEVVAVWYLSTVEQEWQVLGGASVLDGGDMAGASQPAITRALQEAAQLFGLDAPLNCVKLQAAGSPINDEKEWQGLQPLFEDYPDLAVTTLKAWLGHTLGASGIAETSLLLACAQRGVWFKPQYPLMRDLQVSWQPKQMHQLLSLIIGFSGEHAALALRRSCTREY